MTSSLIHVQVYILNFKQLYDKFHTTWQMVGVNCHFSVWSLIRTSVDEYITTNYPITNPNHKKVIKNGPQILIISYKLKSAEKDGGFPKAATRLLFLAYLNLGIRVMVSGPTFNPLFMVSVSVRVIRYCDVSLNMSTAVRIKLHTEKWQFTPGKTSSQLLNLFF